MPAYMGVTNLGGDQFETHVKNIALYAMEIVEAASKILIDEENPDRGCVQIRVGKSWTLEIVRNEELCHTNFSVSNLQGSTLVLLSVT